MLEVEGGERVGSRLAGELREGFVVRVGQERRPVAGSLPLLRQQAEAIEKQVNLGEGQSSVAASRLRISSYSVSVVLLITSFQCPARSRRKSSNAAPRCERSAD